MQTDEDHQTVGLESFGEDGGMIIGGSTDLVQQGRSVLLQEAIDGILALLVNYGLLLG
jgi:hypothetical protein